MINIANSLCWLQLLVSVAVVVAFDGASLSGSLRTEISVSSCVRLFHSKGSIGCRVKNRDGITLPVFLVTEDDLVGKLASLRAANTLVAVVLEGRSFNATTLEQVRATGNVGGILVLSDSAPKLVDTAGSCFYSHDSAAPQGEGTPSASVANSAYKWNEAHGNGLLMQDFDFPINLVNREDTARVRSAAAENLRRGLQRRPCWFAELNFYFGPDHIGSQECLEWRDRDHTQSPQCLPLGGQSVWGVMGSPDGRPIVMATAGIDSTNLFHDASFGANDAVGSIITLLAAADALGRHAEALKTAPRQISFGLFQAEEFGFVGSRRFVADLASFQCKNFVAGDSNLHGGGAPLCLDPLHQSIAFMGLSLNDIHAVIAVDQVARGTDLYVHPTDQGDSVAQVFLDDDASTTIKLSSASKEAGLPPSPLSSFLQELPSLPGAVLTGYDSAFSDPAYHSNLDTSSPSVETAGRVGIDVSAVESAASVLARALYRLATDDTMTTDIEVDSSLVADLVECLASHGLTCSAVAPYVSSEAVSLGSVAIDWGSSPPSYYTSVLSSNSGLPLVEHNGAFYSKFSGEWNEKNDRVVLVPSGFEMFLRSFLALRLNGITEIKDGGSCATQSDCPPCSPASSVTQECVLGNCVCPVSFYHIALDTGLKRDGVPGFFNVVDSTTPLYTEPNWASIGVVLFQEAGSSCEIFVFAAGIAVSLISVYFSVLCERRWHSATFF
mmetsp:Transcript_17556/g.32210  ORF Transcript_17556/g.32210 Transcript_17556/m.32210 type:complete len:724 (-) Transcript_17556:29-2200(-)